MAACSRLVRHGCLVVAFVIAGLSLGGCPASTTSDGPVTAKITYSASSGDAPLQVAVAGTDSVSKNAGALTYAWDFGDAITATGESAYHTYQNPGRYLLTLTVTDSTGATGTDVLEVRVRGGGAVAVIAADVTSGPKSLTVHFDGSQSTATDDTVHDYYWDFDDGATSRDKAPTHTFTAEGDFNVTLKVVSAGGVSSAQTFVTIHVSKRVGALQFNGNAVANLPLAAAQSSLTFTLEAWVLLGEQGGTIFNTSSLRVELVPGENTGILTVGGKQFTGPTLNLNSTRRHVAVVYNASSDPNSDPNDPNSSVDTTVGACTLYVDNVAVVDAPVTAKLLISNITIGQGMRGDVGEVRLWTTARTTGGLAATGGARLTVAQPGLYSVWPLNEGSGQVLKPAVGTRNGYLGTSTDADSADPAWTTAWSPF